VCRAKGHQGAQAPVAWARIGANCGSSLPPKAGEGVSAGCCVCANLELADTTAAMTGHGVGGGAESGLLHPVAF
jgi:hypothetical protein